MAFKKLLSAILLFSVVFTQFFCFFHFKSQNIAFDSASIVVNKGPMFEIRENDQGILIERLFLGLKNMDFQDYLIINNKGTNYFIPLRIDTKFYNNYIGNLTVLAIFNGILSSMKTLVSFEAIIYFLLIVTLLCVYYDKNEYLIHIVMSRIRDKFRNFPFIFLTLRA